MAWIKSDETLSQHPKVDELAEILDLHPAQVIGHLHYLWWWALSYADDGDLTKYKKRIATASNFDGDNDTYINALTTSGWLDQVDDQIHIHDFCFIRFYYNFLDFNRHILKTILYTFIKFKIY